MKINKLTDYSIVLLSHFVDNKADSPSRLLSANDLAKTTEIPYPTVVKLLKNLAKKRLLVSKRGTSGGYYLAKPAKQISVSDVIAASEGPIALTDCIVAPSMCQVSHLCPTQSNWNKINQVIEKALSGLSLTEISPKRIHRS